MDLFAIKKLFSLLTQTIPAGLFLILLASILFRRAPHIAQKIIVTISAVLIALSSPMISNYMTSYLELQYAELSSPPQDTKYVAVLSGGSHRESTRLPSVILSPIQLTRLAEAVRLWRLTPNAEFITTGAPFGRSISSADAMAEIAIWFGVPDSKIIRLTRPRDTESEIQEIADLVGTEPIVIASSASHLPRIAMLASEHRLAVTLAPAEWMTTDTQPQWWRFSSSSLLNTDRIIHEYVGMLVHRIKAMAIELWTLL